MRVRCAQACRAAPGRFQRRRPAREPVVGVLVGSLKLPVTTPVMKLRLPVRTEVSNVAVKAQVAAFEMFTVQVAIALVASAVNCLLWALL